MDLDSEDRKGLVAFLCSRSIANYDALDPEAKRDEFMRFAPIVYPLLTALPENCTHEMLESGEINFRHAAAVTLLMIAEQELGEQFSRTEMMRAFTDEQIADMEQIHLHFARTLLDLIGLYELQIMSENVDKLDLDSELRLLTGD